jgi:hypothetical protein
VQSRLRRRVVESEVLQVVIASFPDA